MSLPNTAFDLAQALRRLDMEMDYELCVIPAALQDRQVVAVRCRATGDVLMYVAVAQDAADRLVH